MGRGEGGGRQRGELGATVCLGPALRADRGWGQVRVKERSLVSHCGDQQDSAPEEDQKQTGHFGS